MARNRVIYQSEALYVSQNASSTGRAVHEQLQRVQSANYSFNISRQDINQFGQLSRIDSIVLEAPTVSFDTSYYLGDGYNEECLGFAKSFGIGFASGHMTASSGKNFYIVTEAEGSDINTSDSAPNSVIGIGNAYLTDYTIDASVGSIPTVSVSFEAANINSVANPNLSGSADGISGIFSPAIAQEDGSIITNQVELPSPVTGVGSITALRPGDISITFGTAAGDAEDGPIVDISGDADGAHIQSASISLSMSRSPLERLGSRFPFARTVDFPVNASLSLSAIVNEVTASNLANIIDNQNGVTVQLTFNERGTSTAAASYKLVNAKLDSESFSSAIGSNKTVDLTFSTQIGGPSDTTNNILFSGASSVNLFQ